MRVFNLGRRGHELLVDLSLVLTRNDLIVGLVDRLAAQEPARAIVLPPELAIDRLALRVDNDTGDLPPINETSRRVRISAG